MNTVLVKHRHLDRDVRVPCGPAYTRPSRRPRPRPRVARERLGIDLAWLLEQSLTSTGRRLDRRVVTLALSLTALGHSRSIVSTPSGVLSCDLPLSFREYPDQETRDK